MYFSQTLNPHYKQAELISKAKEMNLPENLIQSLLENQPTAQHA